MDNYILSCCTTVDLEQSHLDSLDVKYARFHYEIDGVFYTEDFGKTISFEEFYRKMKEGAVTKTSQVNANEFEEHFEKYLKEGKDILHVCLSSGLSGTINSANIAKSILIDKYPDRKIYIVDSLSASSGYGLLIDALANMKKNGKTIDELYNWAQENKLKQNSFFFSTDLSYYVRGGRISKAAGAIGTLLNTCPLLYVDKFGKLVSVAKVRGKKNVIKEIVKRMEENAEGGLSYNGKCFISQSNCLEDAMEVSRLIEEKFPNLDGKPVINFIGTTIGSHTGPGTVALFFWGKEK